MSRLVAVVGVVAVVQLALAAAFRPFGVEVDLLLLTAIAVALASGPERGAVAGFTLGLLSDMHMGTSLGTCAVAYVVAAWVAGALADDANDSLWVVSLLAVAGVVAAMVVLGAVLATSNQYDPGWSRMLTVSLVYVAAAATMGPVLTHLLRPVRSKRMSRV